MKLLVYHWNSFLQHDIFQICKEKNIDYTTFEWEFKDKNHDEEFTRWFAETIGEGEFDALLSVNYYPLLSEMCMKKGMKYLAWCYDTPLNVRRIEETLNNPVNYVFLFDKIQCWQYLQQGFQTVYHLPLGVNRTRFGNLKISDAEYSRFAAEVSFVGGLYKSALYDWMSPLDEFTRGYLQSVMDVQQQVYGSYLLDKVISGELVENINSQYLKKNPDTAFRLSKEVLTLAMSKEVTRRERMILLSLCGKRFQTKLYSGDTDSLIKNVIECGAVEYITETPKVFACSKVNLNPTLKIIQTGIPLRAFEIMGAGGFLLSNYQEEFLDLYENGTDMVIYESMEDAIEKIQFYLKHEDIRSKIAENGRRKTLEEHSLQGCMEKIFETAGI